MENSLSLGQKIRKFRTRARMTQLELELAIDASQGSISRIENDLINPTKETLTKIADVLNLSSFETASIFNLNETLFSNLIKVINSINKTTDLNQLLQNAVDQISRELNLLGVVICIIEDEYLCAKTFTNSWYTNIVLELFGGDFKALKIKMSEHRDHLMVKTIEERTVTHSYLLRDFCSPPIKETIANLAQKITGNKSSIVFPLIVNDEVFGTILYSKNIKDEFQNEYELLKSFAENIAIAISNVHKFEELSNDKSNFRSKN